MLLFHNSNSIIKEPYADKKSRFRDYGSGFYTQPAKILNQKSNSQEIINIFNFDDSSASSECKVLTFNAVSEDWYKYIIACREGKNSQLEYDIINGLLPSEDIYVMLALYELGDFSADELAEETRSLKLERQIVFLTEKSFRYLQYRGSE